MDNKRVCLINPPWSVRKGSIWAYVRSTMPPLGVLMVASVLEQNNYEVDMFDFQAMAVDWDKIDAMVKAWDYDVYGVTATTSITKNAYRMCDLIKKHHPDKMVVLGGAHATAVPLDAAQRSSIDYVVRGEGEYIMLRLLQGEAPETIQGLTFKGADGEIQQIGSDGFIEDLDALPMPAYHKIDFKAYKPAVGGYRRTPAMSMTTTRGCPGRCTFCNSAAITLRKRSADKIVDEIEMLTTKYGIKEISFYDDTFTVYPRNVIRMCELLVEKKVNITWSAFARTDTVSPELLAAMKKAGCHQLLFGIESRNEQILKNIKKDISLEKTRAALRMTREAKIAARCAFMFGNPGETIETMNQTIEYAIELDPDIAMFNITVPYPGTEMFTWAKMNGYLLSEDWDDFDLSEPIMVLPTVTNEEIAAKYREGYRRFYGRPRSLWRLTLRALDPTQIAGMLGGLFSMVRFALSR